MYTREHANQQCFGSEVRVGGTEEVASAVLNEGACHVNVVMGEVVKTQLRSGRRWIVRTIQRK